mmetsp:Transcript_111000/g.254434  ORF Transcript_111000/g.254434 Transcript_111000/m.254434 type:complete len:409 (+) Transcript_111000:101-1327(+)
MIESISEEGLLPFGLLEDLRRFRDGGVKLRRILEDPGCLRSSQLFKEAKETIAPVAHLTPRTRPLRETAGKTSIPRQAIPFIRRIQHHVAFEKSHPQYGGMVALKQATSTTFIPASQAFRGTVDRSVAAKGMMVGATPMLSGLHQLMVRITKTSSRRYYALDNFRFGVCDPVMKNRWAVTVKDIDAFPNSDEKEATPPGCTRDIMLLLILDMDKKTLMYDVDEIVVQGELQSDDGSPGFPKGKSFLASHRFFDSWNHTRQIRRRAEFEAELTQVQGAQDVSRLQSTTKWAWYLEADLQHMLKVKQGFDAPLVSFQILPPEALARSWWVEFASRVPSRLPPGPVEGAASDPWHPAPPLTDQMRGDESGRASNWKSAKNVASVLGRMGGRAASGTSSPAGKAAVKSPRRG